MIRRALWGLWVLFLLPSVAMAETSNRIVAFVNDEVITEGDVRGYMSAVLDQADAPKAPTPAQEAALAQAALQRLIEDRLIVQEAKRLGLVVGQDEVVERLRAVKEQLQTKEAYEQMLDEAGVSEEQLKAKLRDQLLMRKGIDQAVRQTIRVSPAELAQATAAAAPPAEMASAPAVGGAASSPLDEMLVWHLLVRTNEQRSPEEALALATQWREQAMKGASLDELARQHSEDQHAAEGGRLGWVRHGDLLPELDAALVTLKVDELSAPIRSELGVHVLKVLERRSSTASAAAAGGGAAASGPALTPEQQLYRAKFNAAMSAWVNGLKDKAYIHVINE
jgi:peptidyl-prolyl cis-trans isomerase SurA